MTMKVPGEGKHLSEVSLTVQGAGTILLSFSRAQLAVEGASRWSMVRLTPTPSGGSVSWSCEPLKPLTDFQPWLPQACGGDAANVTSGDADPVIPSSDPTSENVIRATSKDQVTEGLYLSGGAKAAVSEFIQDKGRTPKNNAEAGISEASRIEGKYVASVEVQDGTIVVTYKTGADSSIAGHSIYMVPDNSNRNSISWQCYSDSAISRYAPRACANAWTGSQANQTAGSASTPSVQERARSEPATSRQRSRRSEPATSDSSGPVLLFSVPPEYPARAQSRGMEGTVQVQFSIDANGKTKDVIVLQSSSSTFERAAVASILERRYEPPGKSDNRPQGQGHIQVGLI